MEELVGFVVHDAAGAIEEVEVVVEGVGGDLEGLVADGGVLFDGEEVVVAVVEGSEGAGL